MKTLKRLIVLSATLLATAGVAGASAAGGSSATVGLVEQTGQQATTLSVFSALNKFSMPPPYYTAVAVGHWSQGDYALGLLPDGRVFQISDGYSRLVEPLDSIIAIAAGDKAYMALRADGTVWAWGRVYTGQQDYWPEPIKELPKIVAISTMADGRHSLALDVSGKVWAWGENSYGQLGAGNTDHYGSTPKPVVILDRVIAIAGGGYHSLALRADGTVWAWGWNEFGQLGDGSTTDRPTPFQVPNINNAVAIAAGTVHSLALKADGKVWAWGRNNKGQLGNSTTNGLSPTSVLGGDQTNPTLPLEQITDIAAGAEYSLAIRADGQALAWGDNNLGQLGDTTTHIRGWPAAMITCCVPTAVKITTARMTALAGGAGRTLAIKHMGQSWGWGLNNKGQLGTLAGGNSDIALKPEKDKNCFPKVIAAGASHSLGISGGILGGVEGAFDYENTTGDGRACSWGANDREQLGRGSSNGQPVQSGFACCDAIGIAAGGSHSLAIRYDGTVWAWGANDRGQAGVGAASAVNVKPTTPVKGLSGFKAVAAGDLHSLALKADGTVWAWGANGVGQVGHGDLSDHPSPVPVTGLANIVAIAAGGYHSLALRADGTVWAWGWNLNGQLGNNTTVDSPTPVQVDQKGGFTGIKAIAAGSGHSLALKADGIVWAWGWNNTGQLGNGFTTDKSTPASVFLDLVKAIAAGGTPDDGGHSLALKADGGYVWAWGWNKFGQLGLGTNNFEPLLGPKHAVMTLNKLQQPDALADVAAIAAGGAHSLAIRYGGDYVRAYPNPCCKPATAGPTPGPN